MAIVHSHTPELVAFGVSSVPLRSGDNVVPIFGINFLDPPRSCQDVNDLHTHISGTSGMAGRRVWQQDYGFSLFSWFHWH